MLARIKDSEAYWNIRANLTFGGEEFSTLYMTAGENVFSVQTAVTGIGSGSR